MPSAKPFRRLAWYAFCSAVAGGAALWVASHAGAQRLRMYETPQVDPNAFEITTRADLRDTLARIANVRVTLDATKDEAERKRLIASILDLCQEELDQPGNTEGVLTTQVSQDPRTPGMAVRWQGVLPGVEEQIVALGQEGLALYETRYGPRAKAQLDIAFASRNREGLRNVSRRFGLTSQGRRASLHLAALAFESGEISTAARALERVLQRPALIEPAQRAPLVAWLAHCYRDLGERANLSRLPQLHADCKDIEVTEGSTTRKLSALLQQRIEQAPDRSGSVLSHLSIEAPGGNYANTGLHEAPGSFTETAWTRNLPGLEATRLYTPFMRYPAPMVSPLMPIFDGDAFYVNTGDRVVAYDLAGGQGGAPVWTCKPFPTFEHNWRNREPDPNLTMPVSTWRGTVFAGIENPLTDHYHSRNADNNFGLYSHYPKVHRAMCAIDAASGRLLWKTGGEYDGSEQATTNYLSGIVHDGVLYCIASRIPGMAELFLVALNPETGTELWRLRLCYGQQETTMFGRPAREPHPSLPCIVGGRLFVCTNIGGVVCVDLGGRSLDWITRYEYMPRPHTKYIDTYYREVTWFTNPTLYAEVGDKRYIIIAPTDSNELTCLDAIDGRTIWSKRREQLRYARAIAGLRDGLLYLASDGGLDGPSSSCLLAVNVSNGEVRSTLKVTPHDRGNTLALAGRPSMAGNRIYWPGVGFGAATCTIAEIDASSMRVVNSAAAPSAYAASNVGYSVHVQHGVMFTVSGKDYSAGNSQLSARFNTRSLLEAARTEAGARPNDPAVQLRFGTLSLRLGERAEGLRALQKAFELAASPPRPDVRDRAGQLLVGAHLENADAAIRARRFTEALGHVETAKEYATGRSQRAACFERAERALQSQGNMTDLKEFYRDLVLDSPDFGVGSDPQLPVALHAAIRLAALLTTKTEAPECAGLWQRALNAPAGYFWEGRPLRTVALEAQSKLITQFGRDAYAELEDMAKALLAEGTDAARHDLLQRYPLALCADEAALALAENHLNAGRAAEGAVVLQRALDEVPGREGRLQLSALLALCHHESNEKLRARLLASRLLREAPDATMTRNGRQRTFKEMLRPLLESDGPQSNESLLPRLPESLSFLWSRPWGEFTRLPAQPATGANARIHLAERTIEGNHLLALDATSGALKWSDTAEVSVTAVLGTPAGLLFVLSQGFVLYSEDGTKRWEETTYGAPDRASVSGGMLTYTTRFTDTRSRKQMVRVTARDVETGGEIWNITLEAGSAAWLEQAEGVVYALVTGERMKLVMLQSDTGSSIAEYDFGPGIRIAGSPLVSDTHVVVLDSNGSLHRLQRDDLKPAGALETKVKNPLLLERHGDNYIALGLTSIACVDPATGRQVWRKDLPAATVTGFASVKDTLVITQRSGDSRTFVLGISMADGSESFRTPVEAANAGDRVDLSASAAIEGGVVLVFADRRISDGLIRLHSFRLLVLNADGSTRFSWSHEVSNVSPYTQLAVIENFIALSCDKQTFCFGPGK